MPNLNLIADLKNPPVTRPSLVDWFDTLDAPFQKAMLEAAVDRRWSHSSLEAMLRKKHNVACSTESVRAWREANGYRA